MACSRRRCWRRGPGGDNICTAREEVGGRREGYYLLYAQQLQCHAVLLVIVLMQRLSQSREREAGAGGGKTLSGLPEASLRREGHAAAEKADEAVVHAMLQQLVMPMAIRGRFSSVRRSRRVVAA